MFVVWHSVPLKHPGSVPTGAGVDGFMSELFPFAWHFAHSAAFAWFVYTWFGSPATLLTHGLSGCGALVWHDVHDGVTPIGFVYSDPWHFAQCANPAIATGSLVLGASIAPFLPCWLGSDHPCGCHGPFAWHVKQLTFAIPPD